MTAQPRICPNCHAVFETPECFLQHLVDFPDCMSTPVEALSPSACHSEVGRQDDIPLPSLPPRVELSSVPPPLPAAPTVCADDASGENAEIPLPDSQADEFDAGSLCLALAIAAWLVPIPLVAILSMTLGEPVAYAFGISAGLILALVSSRFGRDASLRKVRAGLFLSWSLIILFLTGVILGAIQGFCYRAL